MPSGGSSIPKILSRDDYYAGNIFFVGYHGDGEPNKEGRVHAETKAEARVGKGLKVETQYRSWNHCNVESSEGLSSPTTTSKKHNESQAHLSFRARLVQICIVQGTRWWAKCRSARSSRDCRDMRA